MTPRIGLVFRCINSLFVTPTFVFDASDAMPAAVGAGSEWTQFTAWFGEGKSIAAVAKAIDASWPAK